MISSLKDWKRGIIYRYVSPSGKSYIGQTTDETRRKISHRGSKKTKFSSAISKYGINSFKYEILYCTKYTYDLDKLKRILNAMEIAYIEFYNSFKSGYNMTLGGEGALGVKMSKESLEKRKFSRRLKDPTWGDKKELLIKRKLQISFLKQEKAKLKQEKEKIKLEKDLEKLKKLELKEKSRKPRIIQLDLANNIIKIWDKISYIKRDLGLDTYYIRQCCLRKRCSYHNFKWKFENS